jgi:hypothetical protein
MNKTDLSSVTEEQLLLRQLREGDMGPFFIVIIPPFLLLPEVC